MASGEKGGKSMVASRAKSSMDAGSEGEVILSPVMSGEMILERSGLGRDAVPLALTLAAVLVVIVSRERNVGRFGVDLDWNPVGTGNVDALGGAFAPSPPLLCGGISAVLLRTCR